MQSPQSKKKEKTAMEKFQDFIQSSKRIFKIATRPTRKQYTSLLKICVLGLVFIGLISFVIQIIASVISG